MRTFRSFFALALIISLLFFMARFVLFALVAAAILTAITYVLRKIHAAIHEDGYFHHRGRRWEIESGAEHWTPYEKEVEPLFSSHSDRDPFWVEDVRTIPVR